ncbi:MAG: hypothetical protein AAF329_25340 [Cyanobacteria bacterium P01_A01_bin.17]
MLSIPFVSEATLHGPDEKQSSHHRYFGADDCFVLGEETLEDRNPNPSITTGHKRAPFRGKCFCD